MNGEVPVKEHMRNGSVVNSHTRQAPTACYPVKGPKAPTPEEVYAHFEETQKQFEEEEEERSLPFVPVLEWIGGKFLGALFPEKKAKTYEEYDIEAAPMATGKPKEYKVEGETYTDLPGAAGWVE
jgi:hypothetical protein